MKIDSLDRLEANLTKHGLVAVCEKEENENVQNVWNLVCEVTSQDAGRTAGLYVREQGGELVRYGQSPQAARDVETADDVASREQDEQTDEEEPSNRQTPPPQPVRPLEFGEQTAMKRTKEASEQFEQARAQEHEVIRREARREARAKGLEEGRAQVAILETRVAALEVELETLKKYLEPVISVIQSIRNASAAYLRSGDS